MWALNYRQPGTPHDHGSFGFARDQKKERCVQKVTLDPVSVTADISNEEVQCLNPRPLGLLGDNYVK